MELALQELPKSLQLADDLGRFISRSGNLAREKLEQDFAQITRSHLRRGDAEIVHPKINQHIGPTAFDALVPERPPFGRLLEQLHQLVLILAGLFIKYHAISIEYLLVNIECHSSPPFNAVKKTSGALDVPVFS